MTKTTVVCWIVGIIGIIGFFGTLNIPQIYAGSYMVLCVLIVLGAMYFNVKYKEQARIRLYKNHWLGKRLCKKLWIGRRLDKKQYIEQNRYQMTRKQKKLT